MPSPLNAERRARALKKRAERLEVPKADGEDFTAYRDRPVAFVRDKLGVEPEPFQVDAIKACATEPRVAIRSGHGVGKTALLA